MGLGPSLVLRGAAAGSLFLIIVCLLISANPTPADAAGLAPDGGSMALEAGAAAQVSAAQEPALEGSCRVSPAFSQNILQWCEYITTYSEKHDLAPDLVAALILQESGGDPLAYSHSGAVGLMQVMPRDGLAAAFQCINGPCFANRPSIAELQDPQFNIEYGTRMLAGLLASHANDLREALRAYGPMDVGYSYADTVLGLFEAYSR